jgi:hypothetical protein
LCLGVVIGLEFWIKENVFAVGVMVIVVLGMYIWRRIENLVD